MYLKGLEIAGFKSFAKKGELEFKTPVTAIVGPNGSGKSNVAESFRFVLGEQSMKTLRSARSEDLIFNGSQTAGRANRAKVALTFDNTKKLLDSDFDEVTISRTIHRDGSSEYAINGSAVRLKDIIGLLSGANIGATGHHIISQGAADRVLSVNPKERRIMIEDALGLKIYHMKREESERKLTKTEENKAQVEGLRRELAPHLRFLKRQVEKIEKIQAMREELVTLYKEYFKREQVYTEHTGATLRHERQPLEKELAVLEAALVEAKQTLAALEVGQSKGPEIIALEEKERALRDKRSAVLREIGRLEGEIVGEERRLARERERLENQSDVPVPYGEVKRFVGSLQKSLEEALAGNVLDGVKQLLTTLKGEVGVFIDDLAKKAHITDTDELAEAERALEAMRTKHTALVGEAEALEGQEKQTHQEYVALQEAIEKERSSGREAERKVFEITGKQQEIRMKLTALEGKERSLELEVEEYHRERAEAQALVGGNALEYGDITVSDEEILAEAREEQEKRKRTVERLKIRIEDAGAGSGEEVLKEYKETEERDSFLERELADLEQSAEALRGLIQELTETLTQQFKDGVKKINSEFGNFFNLMFGGGSASLELVEQKKRKRKDTDLELVEEEDEEVEEGVEIKVSLPHKKIRGLEMLSGGERSLTSIALIFAMSQVNPPPFLVLDETDAALDEANSRRYGDMLERLAEHSQLVVITHNRETMSRAGVLYGVTMGRDGASQLLSIDFDEAARVAK